MPHQTPSQTVGPFFHSGLVFGGENVLASNATGGQRIFIQGRVIDGHGNVLPDALVEIWQADAGGRFNHPSDPEHAQADVTFRGFGRTATGEDGRYWFRTIKPGALTRPGQPEQAPHINVRVFARGLLIHLVTRMYFSDESTNARDAVLGTIDDPRRKQTLIAQRQDVDDELTYHFDIVLQGPQETVFFDV